MCTLIFAFLLHFKKSFPAVRDGHQEGALGARAPKPQVGQWRTSGGTCPSKGQVWGHQMVGAVQYFSDLKNKIGYPNAKNFDLSKNLFSGSFTKGIRNFFISTKNRILLHF